MKMLMIVYRESLEQDVRGLLARKGVSAFTELRDVTGTGEAGAAFHSLSWPGLNNMVLAALADAEAQSVIDALKDFRDRQASTEQASVPLRVFALPCDLVV